MSEAEKKVEAAVENVTAAEVAQAEAATVAATGEVMHKTTEAAAVAVAAAEGAAALANETSALAQIEVAKTLTEKEGEISWLKQSVETMGNSLNEVKQNQTTLSQSLLPMMEQLQKISQVILSSTPLKSPEAETPQVTTINPSADVDALAKTAEKPKVKRRRI